MPPPRQRVSLCLLPVILLFCWDFLDLHGDGSSNENYYNDYYNFNSMISVLVQYAAYTANKITAVVPIAAGFQPVTKQQRSRRRRTTFHATVFQDGCESASDDTDNERTMNAAAASAATTITIPIVIMDDALLPNQTLHFSSPDPKFDALMQYSISILSIRNKNAQQQQQHNPFEVGILGLDPPTQLPLKVGVTAPIVPNQVIFGINAAGERVVATSLQGSRRFQIIQGKGQEEPWMDPTNSFYIAKVQILDDDYDNDNDSPDESKVQFLHQQIPLLLEEWFECLIQTEKLSPAGVSKIIKDSGTSSLPDSPRKRAFWVAALLNPTIPLGLCQEIRPAMLSCQNDHDRLLLASVALRSSMDRLWNEK